MNEYQQRSEPDRSTSDFYCTICHSHMNSQQIWDLHVAGKRHLKNMKKAPGSTPSRVKNMKVSSRPEAQSLFDSYPGPLLGLSFMTERRSSDRDAESIYTCYLCQGSLTKINLIEHLESYKHKMLFLKQKSPEQYKMIDNMKHLSKGSISALLEDQAKQWEEENGRETMAVELRKPAGYAPPPAKRMFRS